VVGMGFILSPEDAQGLPRDRAKCVRGSRSHTLNGDDLNARADQTAEPLYSSNFRDWPLDRNTGPKRLWWPVAGMSTLSAWQY